MKHGILDFVVGVALGLVLGVSICSTAHADTWIVKGSTSGKPEYCLGAVEPDTPVYRLRPGCLVEVPVDPCLATMEAAMRAHDALTQADKDLLAQSPWSTVAISGYSYPGAHLALEGDRYVYVPDTRTDEQRLDDEYKALDAKRVQMIEEKAKAAKWERLKAANKAQHEDATSLWEQAKRECWRKP